MGVYLYPTGCGTSHGSVVNFNGKWYQLYHCSNPSGRDELRSVCIDQLEYNPDLRSENGSFGIKEIRVQTEYPVHVI